MSDERQAKLRVAAPRPFSLKLVIGLFAVLALYAAGATGYWASQGRFTVDPLIIAAPIAWGLWRLKPGWRHCAIYVAIGQISVTTIVALMYFCGASQLVDSMLGSVDVNRLLFLYLFALVVNRVTALRRQASAYHQQGKFADARELNHRGIDALKCKLAEVDRGRRSVGARSLKRELASIYNGIAWSYATDPRDAVRDGPKAVALARQACELSNWKVFAHVDTFAAAYAEVGDYGAAVEMQKGAIALLPQASFEREKGPTPQERARRRLTLYEA